MKAESFVYWLQGYFELRGDVSEGLSAEQVATIKRHLAMVFIHEIDPNELKAKLDEAHKPKPPAPPRPPASWGEPGGPVYRC